MVTVPVPVRASVRDLLRDLLGTTVTVSEGLQQTLGEGAPAYLGTYCLDDGTPVAATITNFSAAVSMGAAIGMMAPAEAKELLGDEARLSGDLEEFFREVVNVFAKLLNSPTTRHVKLTDVHEVPGDVPRAVAEVVLEPRVRVDWTLAVEGHEGGVMTLLAV